jgi:hypothetical protein
MRHKFANALFLLLLALATVGIEAGSASAASSPAFAAPGTFSCKAATAANEIPAPPPIWELSGRAPSTEAVATANATKPLCPEGQVPSQISTSGVATPDLTPTHAGAVTGEPGTASELGATSESSVTPPAYKGENCQQGGCYWYAYNEVDKTAIGMEYETNISEPYVSPFNGAHSIDQLAVGGGTEGDQYTMEAGWDVDPGYFTSSPSKPHFFIFVNPDKYGSESCYDCDFVPASGAKITPGEALEPSAAKITYGVKYSGGNWWVWAGTQWIGYVPGSAWGKHFTHAESEANYGEVFDNESEPTSQMGDGQPGSSSGATSMTASLVLLSETKEETTSLHGTTTNSSLYSIGDVNAGNTEWHFGGSGLLEFSEENHDVQEFRRLSGGGWQVNNLTTLLEGHPVATGTVKPFRTKSGELVVFARNTAHQLVEFARTSTGSWNWYNISNIAGGAQIVSAPTPLETKSGELIVVAEGFGNDLLQFARVSGGGWDWYNITNLSGGAEIVSAPTPFETKSGELIVVAEGFGNYLLQFARVSGGGWSWYNITSIAGGDSIVSVEEPIEPAESELLVFA